MLLVDDSVVVRKLVGDFLRGEPGIEIITAANGRLALEKLEQVHPDLVILDVEMPELDGLATLRELRTRVPHVPVVMFSGLTERAGELTLEALALGARDYVTKPSNVGWPTIPVEHVREELLEKVRALLKTTLATSAIRLEPRPGPKPAPLPSPRPRTLHRIDVVGIGASTGGPKALSDLLPTLPADFPVPIVIAQHMPPLFTRLFAERLDDLCALDVAEAREGAVATAGTVWIAPGDFHLEVRRGALGLTLHTHQGPPENACRPAVDVLFRSLAAACGHATLGVIMTGMGNDGLEGCGHIRDAGGQIVAQDEESSVVWSMPGAVVRAGLADEIVSMGSMAAVLRERVERLRVREEGRG